MTVSGETGQGHIVAQARCWVKLTCAGSRDEAHGVAWTTSGAKAIFACLRQHMNLRVLMLCKWQPGVLCCLPCRSLCHSFFRLPRATL